MRTLFYLPNDQGLNLVLSFIALAVVGYGYHLISEKFNR